MAETNIGVQLEATLRSGAIGTWWTASTGGGHPLGMLQLEPSLVAEAEVRDRIAAAIIAVRDANPSGVLRTTELVVDGKRAWLVVATLPAPTLAELLSPPAPDGLAPGAAGAAPAPAAGFAPGAASGLAVDVALALRELHAAGLGHGDLAADTVVITSGGAAMLVEVAVRDALTNRATNLGRDTAAWATLVRELAAVASAPEAELLRAAATTADSGDLATAARRLADRAADLPDYAGRESVVAARGACLAQMPPTAPHIPQQRSTMEPAVAPVILRFGRGIPDAAIAAAAQRAAAPKRRRSLRGLKIAVAAVVLLLAAATAAFFLLSPLP